MTESHENHQAASQIAVRVATRDDAAKIAKIQSDAMVETVVHVAGEEHRGQMEQSLAPNLIAPTWEATIAEPKGAGRGVLIARDGDQVVGFAAFITPETPKHAEQTSISEDLPFEVPANSTQIIALDVDSASQGAGHGSRLLAAVADTIREQNGPGLLVWIVGEDSARVKFFQEAGFRPVGVRRSLDTGVSQLVEHLWFAAL